MKQSCSRYINYSFFPPVKLIEVLFPCFVFRAEVDYEDIKQRYGSQVCYLLKINSRTSAPEDGEQIPDPWSKYLLRNDVSHQVSATCV